MSIKSTNISILLFISFLIYCSEAFNFTSTQVKHLIKYVGDQPNPFVIQQLIKSFTSFTTIEDKDVDEVMKISLNLKERVNDEAHNIFQDFVHSFQKNSNKRNQIELQSIQYFMRNQIEQRKMHFQKNTLDFFRISKIKFIQKNDMHEILKMFKNEPIEKIEDKILNILLRKQFTKTIKQIRNELNEEIKRQYQKPRFNFITILDNAKKDFKVQEKPILNYQEHQNQNCTFFKMKLINFQDPKSSYFKKGIIVNCALSERKKQFQFWDSEEFKKNKMMIEKSGNFYKIKIEEERKMKLIERIKNHYEFENDKIFISNQYPGFDKNIAKIPTGEYLISIKQQVNGLQYEVKLNSINQEINLSIQYEKQLHGFENLKKIRIQNNVSFSNNSYEEPLSKGSWSQEIYESVTSFFSNLFSQNTYPEEQNIIFESKFNQIIASTKTIKLFKIHQREINSLIWLKDISFNSLIEAYYKQQFQQKLEDLQVRLLQNQSLISLLTNNLLKNKLQSLQIQQFKANQIIQELIFLFTELAKKLNTEESVVERLVKMVLEVNYMKTINREKTLDFKRILEAFTQFELQLKPIKRKSVMFVVGPTGSGKSMLISFLLGAQSLVSGRSALGDSYIYFQDEEQAKRYPKSGHSIMRSETTFATGYALSDEFQSFGFIDCPGFKDTRGTQYEIITSLSMEHAIELSTSINSILLNIPASYFFQDRGNQIYSVIDLLQQKFPFAFRPNHKEQNERIFIMVNKHNDFPEDAIEKILNGDRFQTIISQLNGDLVEAERMRDISRITFLEKRIFIWNMLIQKVRNQAIDKFSFNQQDRESLLFKYFINTTIISKLSSQKQEKFYDRRYQEIIHEQTNVWSNDIIQQFLFNIDQKSQDMTSLTKDVSKSINHQRLLIQNNQDNLAEKSKIYLLFQQLLQKNVTNQETQKYAKQHKCIRCIPLQNQIQKLNKKITDYQNSTKFINRSLINLQDQVNQSIRQKSQLNLKLYKLESGQYEDQLYIKKCRSDKITNVCTSTKYREINFEKGLFNYEQERDCRNSYNVTYGQLEGLFFYKKKLSRKYQLAPADEKIQVQLERAMKKISSGVFEKQSFKAVLRGAYFQLDLGINIIEEGRSILYGFALNFKKGRQLPWIEIVHFIPNKFKNAAQIRQTIRQIQSKEDNLGQLSIKIQSKNKQFSIIIAEIKSLQTNIQNLKYNITMETNSTSKEEFKKLLSTLQLEISGVNHEIKENIKELEKLKEFEKDISKNYFQKQKQRSISLAIIIRTQLNGLETVYRFAKDLLNKKKEEIDPSVKQACEKLIKSYQKNYHKLIKKTEDILGKQSE